MSEVRRLPTTIKAAILMVVGFVSQAHAADLDYERIVLAVELGASQSTEPS